MSYNRYCNYDAHYCTSGCCTSYGSCATSYSTCFWTYSDYYRNNNYQFSTNTITTTTYNQDQIEKKLILMQLEKNTPSFVVVGVYLLFIIIGAIVCYCKRKRFVQAVNKFDTEIQARLAFINGEPLPRRSSNVQPQEYPHPHGNYPAHNQYVHPTYPNHQTHNQNSLTHAFNLPPLPRNTIPHVPINDISRIDMTLRDNQLMSRTEFQLADQIVANQNQNRQ